jgi:protein ImuB
LVGDVQVGDVWVGDVWVGDVRVSGMRMGAGGTRMSEQLYLCLHAAEFPAQALLRLRPEMQSQAVAVLEGRAPLEMVCALNRHAERRGVVCGMTRLEAEAIAGLRLLPRSTESEAAARAVVRECAAYYSPRIEAASYGTACSYVLDIAGTRRLFGPPEKLAERLRTALAAAGFRASIAVSANFHTARLKAAATRGVTVIPEGEEAEQMSKLPLASLVLTPEQAETFAVWGIRTLGELAALPEVDLITRLGQQARMWRALARGEQAHTFQPIEPEFALEEFCEFETPVEEMESLLFVGARMIDCLVARATSRALSLSSLTLQMKLGEGRIHCGTIRPALASTDRKFLLKLLQLEFAAHPPQAAVLAFSLSAEAGQSSKVQLGLFAPQTPEPSRLDVTIARLKAIAGEDRVGSPVLEDSNRPGSFRMSPFAVSASAGTVKADEPRIALRRMRPPVPVSVVMRDDKPRRFRDAERSFEITAAYGPWRTSGCWWSTDGWDAEEWDVLATTRQEMPIACLLMLDHARNAWQLVAFYD